jgi:hypothetical protein
LAAPPLRQQRPRRVRNQRAGGALFTNAPAGAKLAHKVREETPMQANALRVWGLGVGGALVAGAVSLALLTGDPAPPAEGPATAGPLPPATTQSPAPDPVEASPANAEEGDENVVFEAAAAEPIAPPAAALGFIVRFETGHPLARAQDLAAQGDMEEAERAAARTLRNRRDLRGLCFDRFTAGGAEIVLTPCEAVSAQNEDRVRRDWETRFAAMAGVAYADVNAVAERERR